MPMRGGLSIVTGASRPRFVFARAVNPLWLADVRRLLATGDEPASTQAQRADSTARAFTPSDDEGGDRRELAPVRAREAAAS
jgi:hypothetical protein